MVLLPGDDCAKAVLQRAKPWEAGRSQNEEWGGTGPWCLVYVAWPQLRPGWSMPRSLLRVALGIQL